VIHNANQLLLHLSKNKSDLTKLQYTRTKQQETNMNSQGVRHTSRLIIK